MNLVLTRVYEENLRAYLNRKKRRALNQGGTSSSKTYSIIQLLVLIATYSKKPLIISIVSETMPHLRKGAMRDFQAIMGDSFDEKAWNKTDHVYRFPNGTIIEFFGADEDAKVRGPRRHILYINEANNVSWKAADQLDVRTSDFVFIDWNPVGEFWVNEYQSGDRTVPGWMHKADSVFIKSTYLDAKMVLPKSVVDNIESRRDIDPNWWNVYGLGNVGKVEGLVYPRDFKQVITLPEQGNEFYTLDFGFSGDPAVLLRNKLFPEEIYSHQIFYEMNLTNQDICERFEAAGIRKIGQGADVIWADSAEPKSIEEIFRRGYNIKGCPKGQGSVEYGHQLVRQLMHYWTQESTECIREERNFRYLPDKDGKLTEKTTHLYSHGMDSRRYGVMGENEPPEEQESTYILDTMQAMGVNMDL